MNGGKRNAMLIELIIVILFFSISVSIVMQLFVASSIRSNQSQFDTAALFYAEDIAEQFAASDLPAADFLEDAGFAFASEAYTKAVDMDGAALVLRAECDSEDTGAGVLDSMLLTAHDGEREALVLPLRRYLPRGAMK